jgi:hypothetical protein
MPRSRHVLTVLVAAGVALVAAVFVATGLGRAYRTTGADIVENHGIPARERSIQGAFGLQISRDFLIQARGFVGPKETYAFVAGPNLNGLAQPVAVALPTFTSYALLPARPAPIAKADWLLCYGCDKGRLPPAGVVVWQDDGFEIVRLRP